MRSRQEADRGAGFTVVEIIVVMAIILALTGLLLATSGYVHSKGARSRAEAEIVAISAALENYKADNGIYPNDAAPNGPGYSDDLDARVAIPFDSYKGANAVLYRGLTGDTNNDGQPEAGAKVYMTFKPNQLSSTAPYYVQDPFGNVYGYSTAGQAAVTASVTQTKGYNPTFDLWSTAGALLPTPQINWVKNW